MPADRKLLRAAVLDEYPWLEQTTDGAAPFGGPAWCLAEEHATHLGLGVRTTLAGHDNEILMLLSGQFDIVITPLLETPARAEIIDFVSYSVSAHCLFGLADNPKVAQIHRIDDLNRPNITVTYITGTPQGA